MAIFCWAGKCLWPLRLDGLAPKALAKRNAGNAPVMSLIISGILSTLLLIFNYTEGLLAAFTFLIAMSTPLYASALFCCGHGRN